MANAVVFLTPREVATLLQVSERTVQNLLLQGELPGACRVGKQWRIREDVLLKSLNADLPGEESGARVG